jgi:hypothetical protein
MVATLPHWGSTWAHMGEILGAKSTNLEPLPPCNGLNFDVKPELLTFKFSLMSEALALAVSWQQ